MTFSLLQWFLFYDVDKKPLPRQRHFIMVFSEAGVLFIESSSSTLTDLAFPLACLHLVNVYSIQP